MLIPYSTDAPIYYLPIVTVVLIVVNILAFVPVAMLDEEQIETDVVPWMLQHGDGLHPLQWLTSNFVHGGVMHLLGNMFSLWGFGLVVEGKIGWWRFLVIYLGIGICQSGLEQVISLGMDGGVSFGASAIIYGIMAMALVWAPQNEMSCILVLGRVLTFDVTILSLAGFCLFLEIATGVLGGLELSSQVLHLMGAGFGFAIGVAMLKRGWVDCENWDLFTVLAGRHVKTIREDDEEARDAVQKLIDAGRLPRWRSSGHPSQPAQPGPILPPAAPGRDHRPARAMVANGQAELAYQTHRTLAARSPKWVLPEADLLKIIATLQHQEKWSASVAPMVEYLGLHGPREAQVRLKLAHVLIESERRPRQALRVLDKLNAAGLNPQDRTLFAKLRQRAEALKAEEPLELAGEDW